MTPNEPTEEGGRIEEPGGVTEPERNEPDTHTEGADTDDGDQ